MDEEPKAGAPMWIVTFADLMSLLMSFFVMLLSFASMDAMKFKQVAESLEKAFGVQREVPVFDKPMGTSPDLIHFAPGKPEETSSDTVKQDTTTEEAHLETFTGQPGAGIPGMREKLEGISSGQLDRTLQQIADMLTQELAKGQLHVEREGHNLIVRIEERGSFPSGSSKFAPAFRGVLDTIAQALEHVPGEISVEGHSDDIPMKGPRFQSNWELSASRAAAVATALMATKRLASARFRVKGYADTKPLVPNDSTANRAINRRVEVVVDLAGPVKELEHQALELIDGGREDLVPDLGWE